MRFRRTWGPGGEQIICSLNENKLCNSRRGSLGCGRGGEGSALRSEGSGGSFVWRSQQTALKLFKGRGRVRIREGKGNEKIRDSVGRRGTGGAALETQGIGVQLSGGFLSLCMLGLASSC